MKRYYKNLCLAAALLAIGLSGALAGEVAVGREAGGAFVVENDFYRLVIDPARGAAVRSFRYKAFDASKEWIFAKEGGLCKDMVWQQQHPGELANEPYECKVVEQTGQVFRLEATRTFQQAPFTGLILRKIYTLRADSPAMQVSMTLENPTDKEMFPGAWVQNCFFSGGNKGVQTAYRPAYLGIRMSYFEDERVTGDQFVRKPADGWAMTFDRDTRAGLLALVDFNYLQMHYSCLSAYTTEFFFDRVLLPAGKSWTTEYTLIPVKDVSNCFYGDKNIFITATQEGDVVSFQVRATDKPVPSVGIKFRAVSSDRSKVLAEGEQTLSQLTASTPQPVAISIPGASKNPVIVSLAVTVNGTTRTTEFMYAKDPAFYHLQETASVYRAPIPKKIKPELMGDRVLKLEPHEGLAVWYACGLWHELNRIPELLKAIEPAANLHEVFFNVGTLGPELTEQPLLAEQLLGYDLLVLNNVGANSLGEAGEIAVQQYVKAGGKLLVCGGIYSMGKGRFNESVLAEVLPVTVGGFFDIKRLSEFTSITGADGQKASLGAVQWVQIPSGVKKDARVLMSADNKPLLVSGTYGEGRVMVWLGTPMGKPGPGVVPYWESPAWSEAMRSALQSFISKK
jgi:hypothetical protein